MTGEGPAVAGADVAAKVGSQAIPLAELEAKASSRMLSLRAQEYRIRRAALEDLIAVSLLEQEAAARNLTVDALIRLEVDDKARTVSDAEVSAVYESAADRFAGMPEAEARKTIAEGIRRQRVSQRRVALIKQLRVKADVRVFLTAPRVTVDPSNNPSRGPATAPIRLVEFSDYECPYCGRIAGTLRSLEQRYRDRLRIVFRDFPLANHKQAAKAAEAASCAGARASTGTCTTSSSPASRRSSQLT